MTHRSVRGLPALAPRVLVTLMLATLLLPGAPARAATPGQPGPQVANANLIADGGFELSAPNSPWRTFLYDEEFPERTTPLCTTATCLGDNLAHTGNGWALFGGDTGPVESAITQTVTISPTFTDLRFWVWLPLSSGSVTDTLKLLVDGHEVWRTDAMATTYALTYTLVSVPNMSQYANGQPHTIAFNSSTDSSDEGFPTVFVVDDVSLHAPPVLQYLPLVKKPPAH